MLFNSISFLIFLPIVFCCHWLLFSGNKTAQNTLLLVSSCVFYSFWDWRFLFLLTFSIISIYYFGIRIFQSESIKQKRVWLRIGLLSSFGILFFFKYFNFFIDSFIGLLSPLGISGANYTLSIILPIGISFYTFHGVSYLLDIYYSKIQPTKNLLEYSLFVAFFPLLVAGPIERATHLLPQLSQKRTLTKIDIKEGLSLMLWGVFKKVIVADSMAMIVDDIYGNYAGHSSLILLFGTVIFAFQIYADFSGYTDIARGVSRFFGIELLRNFNFPFFSKSIPEFWSRWHISLSSFLNDYLFVPLALNFRDYKKWGVYFAVFLTFLVSGFWHGAGWNFVFWGMLHGLYYLPQFTTGNGRLKSLVSQVGKHTYSFKDVAKSLKVFALVCFALLFFRAASFTDAIYILKQFIQFKKSFAMSELVPTTTHLVVLAKSIVGLIIMLVLEFRLFKHGRHIESLIHKKYHVVFVLILLLVLGSYENATQFIYFQF